MPRLTLLFARRYLFSKKSHSVINIIAGVSALAVAIPVAAMVILLSVFNGFEGLIRSMYKSFDPDLLVTPTQGKVFAMDSIPADRLRAIPGVAQWSFSLEENALFEYRDRQYIGVMRGVDSLFAEVVPIDTLITQGNYRLRFGELPEACVGQGIAYTLGIRTTFNDPIAIYVPRSGKFSLMMPQSLYRKGLLFPSGVFALEAEVDGKYMIVPIDFAQNLLDNKGKASSLSIRLDDGYSPESVRPAVAALLGDQFEVLTRYQQKAEFYRIMMYEKWGIYFIILLVLIVASFSLIGSLVMLIIDKRKDIRTLLTMGTDIPLLRRIFVAEGMLIYGIGAVIGMILGLGLSLAQRHWGFLTLGGETFLIDTYPVEVHLSDLLLIVVTFTAVSYLISKLTVLSMIPRSQIRD